VRRPAGHAAWGTLCVLAASVLWGTTGTAATFAPAVGPLAIGAAAMGLGGLLQVRGSSRRASASPSSPSSRFLAPAGTSPSGNSMPPAWYARSAAQCPPAATHHRQPKR